MWEDAAYYECKTPAQAFGMRDEIYSRAIGPVKETTKVMRSAAGDTLTITIDYVDAEGHLADNGKLEPARWIMGIVARFDRKLKVA